MISSILTGNNALGMHIRSQNLNTTPEVGGQILGIFVSNVSTNSPADLSGRWVFSNTSLDQLMNIQ